MKATNSIVSNVWIRQVELEHIGDSHGSHTHTFDHQHLLTVGSVLLSIEGQGTCRYDAPCMILIEKGLVHSMQSLTDIAVGYCIHPIREGGHVEDIVPEGMDPKSKIQLAEDMSYNAQEGAISKFLDSASTPWGGGDE